MLAREAPFDPGFRCRKATVDLRAVILDLEGVWFDHGLHGTQNALRESFLSRGVELSEDETRLVEGDPHPMDATGKVGLLRDLCQKTEDRMREAAQGATDLALPNVTAPAWVVPSLIQTFDSEYVKTVRTSKPIQNATETLKSLKEAGLKIAVIADCNEEALEGFKLRAEYFGEGFLPDAFLSTRETSPKAPQPWLVFHLMHRLGVYPATSVVRVSSTASGIEEGLNAGCWTVGVARTSRLVSERADADIDGSISKQLSDRIKTVYEQLYRAGAHFVIDGIWQLPKVLNELAVYQRYSVLQLRAL
ncbi:unnamed protein product [Vitrella brassicaformis CCMP3155]|uniref:Uncharacterized protein n=2 Tax=Vitrella brassicaformis TaxID=1169539 RepID=A0A0G4EH18_VITBC|nr:unnamed protein product [Vitrella brassicaformis CCMP3155]|eukprot:CEL95764.1 unnamed protein product [Vitrella brassicaformis CCMP3155]